MLEKLRLDLDTCIAKIRQTLAVSSRNSLLQGTLAKSPISSLADIIIDYAAFMNASDIHLEPQEDGLRIRFRIDGVLLFVYEIPPAVQNQLISYLKLTAGMGIFFRKTDTAGRQYFICAETSRYQSFCHSRAVRRKNGHAPVNKRQ